MFTFIVQLLDLVYLHQVGLFLVFFVISWTVYISKLLKARTYKDTNLPLNVKKVSVLVPVVDEPLEIWKTTLSSLRDALNTDLFKSEIIILPNGSNATKETKYAESLGLKVVRVPVAGKRNALYEGVRHCTGEITIILDSDTAVGCFSICSLLNAFSDPKVGGATPRQFILQNKNNIWRRVSDWLEDIRFNEVLKGQNEYVSCLPGRMLAVRTQCLSQCMETMYKQTFLGSKCISGDDRYLTSWLLERGWKCVYVSTSRVFTEAPDTFKGFVKQRLRWSRTSLRETIRSLPWIWKYPYTAYTVLTNVLMRWLFFAVIVNFILYVFGFIQNNHYIDIEWYMIIIGSIAGFLISGFFKQLRHLRNYPEDLPYLVPFLLITTFILTPVEWFGNLTLKESGWMTRKLS